MQRRSKRVQRGGQRRQSRPVGLAAQNGGQRVAHVLTLERAAARQHLVEDAAERPDVRTDIDGLALRLLRRHVGRGAENHPAHRHRRRGDGRRERRVRRCPVATGTRFHRLGEPEVEHLHGAVGAHLDVGGLQVAVDDAVLVRGLERLGNLTRDRQRVLERQRPLRDAGAQIVTLDEFHDQRGGVPGLLEAVDLRDVRMVERGERPRLALEARQPLGIVDHRGGQRLQRHVATQLGVARPIDLAHAAGAEGGENLVWAEAGTGREGHVHREYTSRPAIQSRLFAIAGDELLVRDSCRHARNGARRHLKNQDALLGCLLLLHNLIDLREKSGCEGNAERRSRGRI